MLGLVKYSCGCLGFPHHDGLKAYVIYHCDMDADSDHYSLSERTMDNPTKPGEKREYEELPEGACENILKKIFKLVYDGYRMREVRRALKEN